MSIKEAVLALAKVTAHLTDEEMGGEWAWRFHEEGVRMALLGTHHELRELAVKVTAWRNSAGNPITQAQHTLAGYHAAYWDLQAVFWGLDEQTFEQVPAKDEWAIRETLGHMMGADRVFSALIQYALDSGSG